MSSVIELPQSLITELRRLGVDIESIIVELLTRYLNMDPRKEALVHLEFAKKYFTEGSRLVDKDPVQAEVVQSC